MKYDFTSIMERHGKDAIAVDGLGTMPGFAPDPPKEGFDIIPMWVADMNFPTVPTVQEAMAERIGHPAFGYFSPSDDYFNAIIRWQERRNGVRDLEKKHIGYENGVLGGLLSALNVFCSKGDHVLLNSPTYIGFTKSLANNGYRAVHSPLYLDEENVWRMDYEDMEKKIVEYKIHAAVFCSPYNPVGRVWTRDEIERAMEILRGTMYLLYQMKSGRISSLWAISISPHRASARMPASGPWLSMRPARLLIWQAWSEATILFTMTGSATG